MPIRVYQCPEGEAGCARCRAGFEQLEPSSAPALERCPVCAGPVQRQFTAPSIRTAAGRLDDRARQAGFHKLQRVGQGEYEKRY